MSITLEELERVAEDIKQDFKDCVQDSHTHSEALGVATAMQMLIRHFREIKEK